MKSDNYDSVKSSCVERGVSSYHGVNVYGRALAGILGMACFLVGSGCLMLPGSSPVLVSFGIVADPHYSDRPGEHRVHNESLAKMTECVTLMNKEKVEFLIVLGDMIDIGKVPGVASAVGHLDAIEAVFSTFNGPRYHALGNHDLAEFSKAEFMGRIENTGIDSNMTYYSYDLNGVHFVVLDTCFDENMQPYERGNFSWKQSWMPPEQQEWLRSDLAATEKPVIVFSHHLLSRYGNPHVRNSDKVREILEADGNVLAAFSGHHHRGDYDEVNGIHYYGLKAMVEGAGSSNNAYAIVNVHADGSVTVNGYRQAVSMTLKRGPGSGTAEQKKE